MRDAVEMEHETTFERLKTYGAPPAIVGFGISTPEHVRKVLKAGADGAISGSAVVKLVERYSNDPSRLAIELEQFVGAMKRATVKPGGQSFLKS
jgi:tryptophan synthase alpha chain